MISGGSATPNGLASLNAMLALVSDPAAYKAKLAQLGDAMAKHAKSKAEADEKLKLLDEYAKTLDDRETGLQVGQAAFKKDVDAHNAKLALQTKKIDENASSVARREIELAKARQKLSDDINAFSKQRERDTAAIAARETAFVAKDKELAKREEAIKEKEAEITHRVNLINFLNGHVTRVGSDLGIAPLTTTPKAT